jgi:hypothetical protein
MSGPSSVDDMVAMPFQAPGKAYRAAYVAPAVTASWLPGSSVLVNEFDCSLGAGASYAPPDLPTPVPLADCFQRCKEDPKCDAIRVDWWSVQEDWSARHVGCGLRGGIANASKCTHAPHHNNSINVRYSMFAIDAPAKSQLAVAISMLAGYRTEPQHGWSAGPKPGDSGGWLPALLTAARRGPKHTVALRPLQDNAEFPQTRSHYSPSGRQMRKRRACLYVCVRVHPKTGLSPHCVYQRCGSRSLRHQGLTTACYGTTRWAQGRPRWWPSISVHLRQRCS